MSRVSEVEVDKAVDTIRHMSLDDLKILSDEISLRRNALSRQNMREISVGDQVQFTGRNGGIQTGRVEKKAIKYCTVDTGFGRWKVPASMLTIV
jgi:ribosomal protein L22